MVDLIADSTVRTGPTTATAAQTDFSYDGLALAESDFKVWVKPTGTTTWLQKEYPGDFSVTGLNDDGGGVVKLVTALSAGDLVLILINFPQTQQTKLDTTTGMPGPTVQQALNRLQRQVHALEDKFRGTLVLEETDDRLAVISLPTPENGKFVRWASSLDKMENVDITTISNTAAGVDETDPDTTKDKLISNYLAGQGLSDRLNMLINGDGLLYQLNNAGGALADGTYFFDQWILLSDGASVITPTQDNTNLPTGARQSMKLTVSIANKKFGLFQPIESNRVAAALNDVVSLQAKLKASGLSNVRMAVVSWSGTADTLASKDIVSTWNASGVDPTLIANWTYENTPANINVSGGSWATEVIRNIAIDTASVKQFGVFLWVDDTDAAVNDVLWVTDVKVERGPMETPFIHLPYHLALLEAWRYFYPVTEAWGEWLSATDCYLYTKFPTLMRVDPGMGTIQDTTARVTEPGVGTVNATSGTRTIHDKHQDSVLFQLGGFSGRTAGNKAYLNNQGVAVLYADARL